MSHEIYVTFYLVCFVYIISFMGIHVTYLIWLYFHGFVQDCSNSSANTLELLQSCTKPARVASLPQGLLNNKMIAPVTVKWPWRIWVKLTITTTTRTPAFWDTPTAPWLPILVIHIRSQVKTRQSQSYKLKKKKPKIQIFKFCQKFHKRHTFWSCLIRCINMKWIQPEL